MPQCLSLGLILLLVWVCAWTPLSVGCGVLEGPGYKCLLLFTAPAAGLLNLPGPEPPPEKGKPTSKWAQAGKALALTMARSGCFQGTRSGSGRARLSVNVLPWPSALGGVASGSWERASGFGPWESWPRGGGFGQAPLAISPTAVHTQDRPSQRRGPAGPYREPCHIMGSGLSSGLGTEAWVLGLLCQVLAMGL